MDSSGAVLAGVTVTAKNAGTAISRTAVTDDQGRYRLSDLAVGNYEIRANLSGFKELVQIGRAHV